MSYLEQLKRENMHLGALPKLTKTTFDSSDSRSRRHFPEKKDAPEEKVRRSYQSVTPDRDSSAEAEIKKTRHHHPHRFRKKTSWMAMAIICVGVECDRAYLPGSGGLLCGLNHEPVLMMSACPEGLWDRGYPVFAPKKTGVWRCLANHIP